MITKSMFMLQFVNLPKRFTMGAIELKGYEIFKAKLGKAEASTELDTSTKKLKKKSIIRMMYF